MQENLFQCPVPIPLGGAICDVYARTDLEHGVHKAPANQVVENVKAMVDDVTEECQAALNARGINVIRDFGPLGVRVWGARTLDTDRELQYINVRRYLIYPQQSNERGTRWVVFEPNSITLWCRLRQNVEEFLLTE